MAKRKQVEELKESDKLQIPTGLTVYAVTANTVHLHWNPVEDVDAVHIERSKDGETWKSATESTGQAHSDGGLEPKHRYYYRAYASKDGERSVYSEVIEANTSEVYDS